MHWQICLESAAWGAAWFPDMFYNLYLMENHNIDHYVTAVDIREKVSTDVESLKYCNFLTKF